MNANELQHLLGVATLIVSWLVYDGLCRSPLGARPLALGATLFVGGLIWQLIGYFMTGVVWWTE